MKHFGNPLLSFAAPFLVLIGLLGFFHRDGRDKLQSLPAIVVGGGLILTGGIRRIRRRKMLLLEIKKTNNSENV